MRPFLLFVAFAVGCTLPFDVSLLDGAARDAAMDAPGLDAPMGDAPMLDAPVLDAPMLDAPGLDAPTDAGDPCASGIDLTPQRVASGPVAAHPPIGEWQRDPRTGVCVRRITASGTTLPVGDPLSPDGATLLVLDDAGVRALTLATRTLGEPMRALAGSPVVTWSAAPSDTFVWGSPGDGVLYRGNPRTGDAPPLSPQPPFMTALEPGHGAPELFRAFASQDRDVFAIYAARDTPSGGVVGAVARSGPTGLLDRFDLGGEPEIGTSLFAELSPSGERAFIAECEAMRRLVLLRAGESPPTYRPFGSCSELDATFVETRSGEGILMRDGASIVLRDAAGAEVTLLASLYAGGTGVFGRVFPMRSLAGSRTGWGIYSAEARCIVDYAPAACPSEVRHHGRIVLLELIEDGRVLELAGHGSSAGTLDMRMTVSPDLTRYYFTSRRAGTDAVYEAYLPGGPPA